MATTRAIVAIDPGLNSMGWAVWPKGFNSPSPYVPKHVGLLHAPRKYELVPRALWLAREIESVLADLDLDTLRGRNVHFVSEYPAWHGEATSKGWKRGDMQKVCLLVGVIAGYFCTADSFTPVTPNEWKGQLPKDVVIRRLTRKFGPGATQEWEKDVWDAVGIGLWKMGRF